jgi:hypothetical protein
MNILVDIAYYPCTQRFQNDPIFLHMIRRVEGGFETTLVPSKHYVPCDCHVSSSRPVLLDTTEDALELCLQMLLSDDVAAGPNFAFTGYVGVLSFILRISSSVLQVF